MNLQIVEKIIAKTDEIKNICQNISDRKLAYKIDVDLLLSKIRDAYDEALTLDASSKPVGTQVTEPIIAAYAVENEPVVVKTPEPELVEEPVVQLNTLVIEPVEEAKPEPKIETFQPVPDVSEIKEEPKNETPEIVPPAVEPVPEVKKETKEEYTQTVIVPERSTKEQPRVKIETYVSVHDKLSEKTEKEDFASKLQAKALTDINEGISLGEKYYYVNELFGKNPEKYNKTIAYLNGLHSFEEAAGYLQEKFKWDGNSEAAGKFYELLKRKYKD